MNRSFLFALTLLLLSIPGCLEFDAQDVTMRYDANADRIDFLVIYRGVFVETGSGKTDDPMANAFTDLEEVLENGQCYFWSNWPLKVDPVSPPARTAALAAHVEVENGGFFTEPTGRLNGYQFVRIVRAKQFIAKLNMMLELGMQAAVLGGFRGVKLDADTKEFVTEFLRSGEKMLTLEAGRIELRLPVSTADFKKLLLELEGYMARNVPQDIARRFAVEKRRADGDESSSTGVGDVEVALGMEEIRTALRTAAGLRFFWDNEITIDRSEEVQSVGIGARGNRELTVIKASDGFYSDNFLEQLRARGYKLEDGVPDQEIRRRFDEFGQRAAKIPEALRAARTPK